MKFPRWPVAPSSSTTPTKKGKPLMNVYLCGQCYLQGYCRRLECQLVTEQELTPLFIRDVRAHMRSLNISPDKWGWFLIDAYRDYPGLIINPENNFVVDLATEGFEEDGLRHWFRDLLRPVSPATIPRVRKEARNRFKVMATILRGASPVRAILWGKQAANDVAPPTSSSLIQTGMNACPYQHFPYCSHSLTPID